MRPYLLILAAVLCGAAAQAKPINPDGYIGSMTVSLDASYEPLQNWQEQKSFYWWSQGANWYDQTQNHHSFIRESGYSADMLLKYPLSESMTFGIGGAWEQRFTHTQDEYVQGVSSSYQPTAPTNTWTGVSTWDDNHGIYKFKVHLVYYFGTPRSEEK